MIPVLYVALGGALGASLRYGLSVVMGPVSASFPWAILLVNIVGCAAMGALAGMEAFVASFSLEMRLFLMTGILGGFTTFSAFAMDTVLLWQRGELVKAGCYVVASVICSLLAFVLAMSAVKVMSHV